MTNGETFELGSSGGGGGGGGGAELAVPSSSLADISSVDSEQGVCPGSCVVVSNRIN